MSAPDLHVARFADLDAATLYALLRLRVDVFVVEQACAYPELDGLDTAPGTYHLWYADADGPVAYLRILTEPDGGARIGRVCTAPRARRTGLGHRLLAGALDLVGDRPARLEAQSYATDFYVRHGFAVTGAEYVEDGIPHVPMARG